MKRTVTEAVRYAPSRRSSPLVSAAAAPGRQARSSHLRSLSTRFRSRGWQSGGGEDSWRLVPHSLSWAGEGDSRGMYENQPCDGIKQRWDLRSHAHPCGRRVLHSVLPPPRHAGVQREREPAAAAGGGAQGPRLRQWRAAVAPVLHHDGERPFEARRGGGDARGRRRAPPKRRPHGWDCVHIPFAKRE